MFVTIKGYVSLLPNTADNHKARVAVVDGDKEYHIIARAAGADMDDNLSALVEVHGTCTEEHGVSFIQVRSYTVLDDEIWSEYE